MAQPKILFYKGTSAPDKSTHGIGTLWFDKANRVLKVRVAVAGTDSDWEQYAGKIDDIQLNNGIMTIKKADGTNYTIDLTDIASAGAVKDALDALDAKISANDTAIKANTTAIGNEVTRATGEEARIEGKVNANTTAIGTEKSRAEGEEARIEAKVDAMDTAYKAADTALDGRIDTLEAQITGLNGTLHFIGIFDEVPAEIDGKAYTPSTGDFYITTAGVEYIYDGTKWEKIGDTSAESAAISALQGRMDTAEGDIDAVEGRMTTAESKISTLEQGFAGLEDRFYTEDEVDAKVADLQGQITGNDGDITALQNRAKNIEDAATALSQKVTANENAIKTKAAQSDLEAAVARVAANEGDIAGLKTSTSSNSQAITKEAQDRAAADEALQGNINTVDGKVATEKSRAEAAEGALGGRIDGVVSRVSTLETEMDSAEGRIGALETASATYATKTELGNETSAREAAVNGLDSRVAACELALTWSGFEE